MTSIKKTTTKSGEPRYIVRYRDPRGEEREKWFARKVDAERYRAKVKADIDSGTYIDPRGGRIRLEEWIEQHERTKKHRRPSTEARDRSLLDNHVIPAFGDYQIGRIQAVEVREWIASLVERGLAANTVTKAHQLLSSALEAAADDELIARNPARRVDLPKAQRHEMRFLTVPEIDALSSVIHSRFRALVITAAYTGLRFGELAGLRLPRLNLLRRSLRVEESVVEVKGKLHFGPPKSNAARRNVALPRHVANEIARHLDEYPPGENGLVFTSLDGSPLRNANFRHRHWAPAVEASVGSPCRFHDLRHTHAALLIAAGQHPKVIQSRLGHASIRTTLDTYGHLFEGLDEAAADALDDAIQQMDVGLAWG